MQLDSKKSPLALLAQTCSQIGVDTNTIKPTMDKAKKSESSKSPSVTAKTPKSNSTSPETKTLAFKPYELNVLTKSDDRPSSKASSGNSSVYEEKYSIKNHNNNSARIPSRNKVNSSPETSAVNNQDIKLDNGKNTPNSSDRKSISPDGLSQRGASPIIRSGLEMLQGHPKDLSMSQFKPGSFGLNPLAALCCPPGMEQHSNPAFRSPFGGQFSPHHAAMLAAAAAGYPGASTSSPNPYVSYTRVKTPSGGETIVPVCKDPYCTGCPYSQHNHHMMMGAPCPSGCTQCEHQKYGLAMAAMSSMPPSPYAQLGRPLVCSWIVGESYCGKRCGSSEELIQHLRTHTTSLSDPAAISVLAQAQQAMMHPLSSLFAASALHRGYPAAPLSPLSAARYHPYGKPGSLPPPSALTTAGSPYAAFNPAALSPYYSPYAMYGQRLGAAVAPQ